MDEKYKIPQNLKVPRNSTYSFVFENINQTINDCFDENNQRHLMVISKLCFDLIKGLKLEEKTIGERKYFIEVAHCTCLRLKARTLVKVLNGQEIDEDIYTQFQNQ